MKNLIKGLAFLSMLSLSSCTKVLYTHEQVMNRYQTKQDVLNKFGVPAEKRTNDNGDEELLYKFDSKGAFTDHSSAEQLKTKTAVVTKFGRYKRYIIFTMDKQGNVARWQGDGMNLEERQKNPGGTIALVAGGVAFTALMVILAHSFTGGLNNALGNGSLY